MDADRTVQSTIEELKRRGPPTAATSKKYNDRRRVRLSTGAYEDGVCAAREVVKEYEKDLNKIK